MRAKHEMLDHLPFVTTQLKPTSEPLDISYTLRRFAHMQSVPSGLMGMTGEFEDRGVDQMVNESQFLRQSSSDPIISTEDPGYYAYVIVLKS
jgi:hypothetical protein